MSQFKDLLAAGQDEQVEVNQRALIDKVLARYSGEHTLQRELLQNADDAGATNVELHFRTETGSSQLAHPSDSLPSLKTHKISSMMVRNDGLVFREEDWNRLKKIAEGNPDENKIGAFGVGFYSLFSVCDEPVVSSGTKIMGFYWKNGGDQLYVKTAIDPAGPSNVSSDGKPWSTFVMDLREPAPMPEPHEFARFLSTCLGFTTNLRTLSMHFDSHLLFRVTKTIAPSRPISLKPNLSAYSPLKILRLTSIAETPVQLRAEVSRWLTLTTAKPKPSPAAAAQAVVTASSSFASKMLAAFSSKSSTPAPPPPSATPTPPPPTKDPFSLLAVTLFLRVVSGSMKVSPSSSFSAEMVRATKKALPSATAYSLIWTGKDEFDATHGDRTVKNQEEEDARRVFAGLLSDLDSNGRVFIGFPTFQTTGCAASIAARLVSTVERESIDFQARYVADWNKELLAMGGIVARSVYEEEMEEIKKLYKEDSSEEQKKKLQERALHLMRFFTFTRSTPQEIVSTLTETSFFASDRSTSLTLISQLGPTPAHLVRLPNPSLSPFLKAVPVIPDLVATGAPGLMNALRARQLIRDISLDDVLADLGAHPLSITEAAECFKWWMSLAANRSYDQRLLARFKEAAMLSVKSAGGEERILPLGSFKTYLNPKIISVDMPLPDHTLPFELSRTFTGADLSRVFQFEELSLVDFAKHVVSPRLIGKDAKADTNVLVSPHFAEKVLTTLARGWTTLSTHNQVEVAAVLSPHAFIPTRQGSRLAGESYFASVVLFEDLPILTLPSGTAVKGTLEKVLLALGVRKHVELQLVFTRLLGQDGGWSHVDVVRYLVSVRESLAASELERLKKTAWLPKEGESKVAVPPGPDGAVKKPRTVRYSGEQLFEPTDAHRSIGLPLLDWTAAQHKWRSSSEEAKLLFDLGLRKTPSVDQILAIAASPEDPARRTAALRYFLDEYQPAGFGATYLPSKHAFPFVPAVKDGQAVFGRPNEVFSNPEAASLGFMVLANAHQADATRFKLNRDPTSNELISALLRSPPKDLAKAREVFAYLSSRVSHFSSSDIATLQRAKIIPVNSHLVEPTTCFFQTDSALPPGLKSLFVTVPDFGLSARPFLVGVGVKETPSTAEVATMVIADPDRFLELSGSSERYLSVLRMLASSYHALPSTLRSRMKMSAFFLGAKRIPTATNTPRTLLDEDSDDEDGGSTALVYQLSRASDLAVNDDPQAFRVFQAEVLACPQEDALEALAESLGAPRISKLVTENYRTLGEPDPGSKRAVELHRAVAERTFLFLSERRQQYGKGELKHDAEWIQNHLQVFEVRSIELVRSLTYSRTVKRHTQAASASAQIAPKGTDVQLFFSADLELDYYEVATGLCKLLLSKQRANDALLFMTILSTSLKNLARRGFNVERILSSRKAEKAAADERLRQERAQAQLKAAQALSPDKLAQYTNQLQQLFADADPDYLARTLQQQQPPHVENAANAILANPGYPRRPLPKKDTRPPPYMPSSPSPTPDGIAGGVRQALQSTAVAAGGGGSSDKGLFSSLRRQFARPESRERAGSNADGGAGLGAESCPMDSGSSQDASLVSKPPSMVPNTPASTPTNTDAIRQNVRKAIQASRPEMGTSISNAVQKTTVTESESSYCDSTAGANLAFVANVDGLRFFLERDVTDVDAFMTTHHEALLRFVQLIVRPVGEVYQVDPRALHIFWDARGPLIAFNRNGSIYFNQRYYEAWHDADVVQGKRNDALIACFHTLAHEIAHNICKAHDSEHSFYTQSILEEHFMRMAQLLSKVAASSRRA